MSVNKGICAHCGQPLVRSRHLDDVWVTGQPMFHAFMDWLYCPELEGRQFHRALSVEEVCRELIDTMRELVA